MADTHLSLDHWRRRLIFRSDHRGTKEMDIIMGGFARRHVPSFGRQELEAYDALLQENDPNLYNWLTEKETPPDHVPLQMLARVIEDIKRP